MERKCVRLPLVYRRPLQKVLSDNQSGFGRLTARADSRDYFNLNDAGNANGDAFKTMAVARKLVAFGETFKHFEKGKRSTKVSWSSASGRSSLLARLRSGGNCQPKNFL